jgi:hypothetical protein
MPTLETLDLARKQIEFARSQTTLLLADIDDADWFTQPSGSPTHVAWQVGHLAMAQYGLCLFRIRGRRSEDMDLMSGRFRKQFSRGSTPDATTANNPSPSEIRAVLDRVNTQATSEMAGYDLDMLSEKVDQPHAVFDTKLGALLFCSFHEMIHVGQLGVIRRLMGKNPIR